MAKRDRSNNQPKPPVHLDNEALLEWQRACDELAAAGQLEAADRAVLTLYAETWAVYRDAMRHVLEHGAVIKWPNGTAGPSPFYKVSRECANQLRGLLADLGLTPRSRKPGDIDEP